VKEGERAGKVERERRVEEREEWKSGRVEEWKRERDRGKRDNMG